MRAKILTTFAVASLALAAAAVAGPTADTGALQPFGLDGAGEGGITPASSAPAVQYNPNPSNPNTGITYANTPHPSDGRFSTQTGEGPVRPLSRDNNPGSPPDAPATPLPSPFGLGACGLLSVMAISRRRIRR